MKKLLLIPILIFYSSLSYSQNSKRELLKELSETGCKCIDSIVTLDKPKNTIVDEIHKCIDTVTSTYQVGAKIADIADLEKTAKEKNGKKQINISINMNKESDEYKKYYYEVERYMTDSCSALKDKMARNNLLKKNSFSDNQEAVDAYNKGLDEYKNGNYDSAVTYFKKALQIDSNFAFAWDNLGITYRKMENYDKAIEAYQKSLEVDPEGLMPLQNLGIVYQYKKEYQKAIDAYKKLGELDQNNPEVFYGIGQTYLYLNDYENALDNICKAYILYIEQKSPYRTDAEKLVSYIYAQMNKQGKAERFNEILKSNKIEGNFSKK